MDDIVHCNRSTEPLSAQRPQSARDVLEDEPERSAAVRLPGSDSVEDIQGTDQIETKDAGLLGEVVSVTISVTVDIGSTTFSLLVPFLNLRGHTNVAVHTEGITTMHRTSLAPPLDQGQRETYTVIPLHGTASQVDF